MITHYHIVSVFNIHDNEICDYDEYFTSQADAFIFQDILSVMEIFSIYVCKTENCH